MSSKPDQCAVITFLVARAMAIDDDTAIFVSKESKDPLINVAKFSGIPVSGIPSETWKLVYRMASSLRTWIDKRKTETNRKYIALALRGSSFAKTVDEGTFHICVNAAFNIPGGNIDDLKWSDLAELGVQNLFDTCECVKPKPKVETESKR